MESLVDRLKSTYSGRRVLVTGHNGFKGSWLVALLEFLGAEVHGISLELGENSPFRNFHKNSRCVSHVVDIRDFESLKSRIEEICPEIVFHLAAQSLVLESYENPRETFEVNVQGTANLLESLDHTSFLGIIAATTDKVYSNDNSGRIFCESDELWGYDPYSLSKTGTELAISAWRNLPKGKSRAYITVRAGNVFGPGDRGKHRLLPDLLESIRSDSIVEIRSPESVRPWQYVLDPLIGYLFVGLKVLNTQKVSTAYNFGPSHESFLSVIEFVKKLQEIKNFQFNITEADLTLESKILKIDSSLAAEELGWRSTTTLVEGLNYAVSLDSPQIEPNLCLDHVEEYLTRTQNSLM